MANNPPCKNCTRCGTGVYGDINLYCCGSVNVGKLTFFGLSASYYIDKCINEKLYERRSGLINEYFGWL